MVKSLVSKLQASSNLSLAQTFGIGSGSSGAEETNYAKHRNDPGRFFGDGVQFKAKLIGILEVGEARGDRMCQEALQDLKMAIRAAGEHKQRIIIHVTIDGLRLRDEKTSDSLYHHPVHKISFIAQDMTDSRAFGYIFGSPDSGHRFFGIKTDKAASQVVLAMRDLFQVVFELKKKEIEMARQQIQGKTMHDHATQLASLSSLKASHNELASGSSSSAAAHAANLSMLGGNSSNGVGLTRLGVNLDVSKSGAAKEISPESVADLVDLEQELTSLQRGISQMERITPNEPGTTQSGHGLAKSASEDDPFGDSFIYVPSYNILPPPPESGRTRHKQQQQQQQQQPNKTAESAALDTLLSPAPGASGSPATLQTADDDDSWLHELQQQNDVFDTTKVSATPTPMSAAAVLGSMPMAPLAARESSATPTQQSSDISAASATAAGVTATATTAAAIDVGLSALSSLTETESAANGTTSSAAGGGGGGAGAGATAAAVMSDAFTDLDPLGIGRTRPYVDKKYFFQELKNPPKKLLKELGSSQGDNFDDFLSGRDSSIFEESTTATAATAAATTAAMTTTTTNTTAAATVAGSGNAASCSSSTTTTTTNPLITTASLGQHHLLLTNSSNSFRSQPSPTPPHQAQSQSLSLSQSHSHSQTQTPSLYLGQVEDFSAAKLKLMLRQSAALSKPINQSVNYYTTEPTITNPLEEHQDSNPVLLPRDTDPFSPTRKKSDPDPFQDGDLFAKLDAFEFDVPQPVASTAAPASVFNGPLQVQLPPEQQPTQSSESWQADISRLEPAPLPHSSSVRHRPTPVASVVNVGGPLDVISSISNKKMPHLFGQARFSKRGDSASGIGSSVNMRRLQESDSLSENEAAPEPPPRPDSTPYAEPPPLPPKKQFSDLVIRPSPAAPPVGRYEYLNHSSNQLRRSADAPPIPLPSRRVGRSDGNFPGPGRPRKPGHTDDDYLAPLGGTPPPLLPPPTQSSSSRARPQRQASLGRPQDIYENKAEILQAQAAQAQSQKESAAAAALAPDITLAQLLTLGMDELAVKLNVPASKLSTMTLVQLTAYLSEFLQASNDQTQPKSRASPAQALQSPATAGSSSAGTAAVFKVNFDQQTSFVAKFDDTFGEDVGQDSFVANFANFNEAPVCPAVPAVPAVPPADRYAVFREIIDQELQQQQQETDLMGDLTPPPVDETQQEQQQQQQQPQQQQQQQQQPLAQLDIDVTELEMEPPPPKIDTKITEVVAQAKDRYAALRDIILVENLFDKPPPSAAPAVATAEKDLLQDLFSDEFNEDQDIRQIMDSGHDRRGLVDSRGLPAEPSSSALTVADDDDDDDEDAGGESSMDSNEKDAEPVSAQDQYEKLSTSAEKPEFKSEELLPPKQDNKFLTVISGPGCAGRDDIEIDELMQRAISNLSLDSRDRTSPATSSAAPSRGPPSHSLHTPSQFNDVSTSPIPLQKSPAPIMSQAAASPVPSQLSAVSQLIDTATKQMQGDRDRDRDKPSWATFDSPKMSGPSTGSGKGKARLTLPPPPASNTSQQDTAESPCSSDPRDDAGGWSKQQQQRRWAKKERQQTSSSSRDLSPWDDETPEYLKQQRRNLPPPSQLAPHPHAHGYYMRHARRLNSCDEDYDYDAELCARRDREHAQRKFKHGLSRSRDNFELDSPSWYHHPAHHTWSPQEMEQGVRARSFERSAYERSSYGPPAPLYDKRGQPLPRDRERERSKYREREYRDYARPGYEFEYENVYDERRSPMGMGYKSRPDYIYERDSRDRERERERERKSFDHESVESFESSSRRRRSFGSGGDVYGSLDSRDEYRERDRELKTRSLRKPATSSAKLRVTGDIDYEQDSEQDFQRQRSLQRPSQLGAEVVPGAPQRLRKSSGSSPWDGEEPAPPGQKSWKRPASAAETERRLAESRRAAALGQTPSDGEKDRRFRKKTRARSTKDLATVGARYGSGRGVRDNYDYISCQRNDDDDDDEDYVDDEPPTDEDKFERLNRRRHEMHQRMLESERRQQERHAPTLAKLPGQNRPRGANSDYGFVDSYEQTPTPRSNASSTAVMMSGGESSAGVGVGGGGGGTKFNFDDGFESDFNQSSPPPAPAGTASSCNSTPAGLISTSSTVGSKSLFRFSNDFSEREKLQQQQQQQQQLQHRNDNFDMEAPASQTPPITQKLRFDDNVKVSQFDDAAFEDDFAKASFDFDKEQASPAMPSASSRKQNMRSSKLQQRQELIKKSESVNIFAKKQEDPFEDDEFFKSPDEQPLPGQEEQSSNADANKFQWNEDNNFAKFDENM
ncbi:PREDICTED: protein disabled [Drosophila arizonae]|uniref:Protein disabled n=1 Tax=Drosophila arizonae TaxID=7263 RepID=A0ABM1P322_DROAR|nr:PREDICTED: protein disabled [Drosophila arizonae]